MKGIAFRTDLIHAIERGDKDMTRRMTKLEPINTNPGDMFFVGFKEWRIRPGKFGTLGVWESKTLKERTAVLAPYEKGEIVYVKEKWAERGFCKGRQFCKAPVYESCGDESDEWKNSRFMPQSAARLFLRVLDVRVERLWDISPEDAEREGIEVANVFGGTLPDGSQTPVLKFWRNYETGGQLTKAKSSFYSLWDSIYAEMPLKRVFNNPWLWVVTFAPTPKPTEI